MLHKSKLKQNKDPIIIIPDRQWCEARRNKYNTLKHRINLLSCVQHGCEMEEADDNWLILRILKYRYQSVNALEESHLDQTELTES